MRQRHYYHLVEDGIDMGSHSQIAAAAEIREEEVIEAGGLSRHAEGLGDGEAVTWRGECVRSYFAASFQIYR